MPGSPQAKSCPCPQSWVKKRPKQRPASATSLSFPTKPPGARQLMHPPPSHPLPASQAFIDPDHRQVDLLNHCRLRRCHHHQQQQQQSILPVSSPVNISDNEDRHVVIYGTHSFGFDKDSQTNFYPTGADSAGHQFAGFSDSLLKRDHHLKRICPTPLTFAAPEQRSLTRLPHSFNYEMTTTTTAPNSPPDLSGSKSSKSSSFDSSHLDNPDGITDDVSNFEEIGLDEDPQSLPSESNRWDRNGIPTRSSSQISLIDSRQAIPARDVNTMKKRPTYPSLHGQVRDALGNRSPSTTRATGIAGPVGGIRRGFTAPATATLSMPVHSGYQPRTRSSSPSPKQPASASFAATGHNVRYGPGKRSSGPPSRRGSWQPSRKTITELEAEYHDSDDELPDEASLWNVPMSPRPPNARPSSTRSSNRGSPEREGTAEAPPPIPLSHPVFAPESPPRRPTFPAFQRHRAPPRTSSLQANSSTSTSPTSSKSLGFFREARAESRTLAMAALSEEARVLTETLEFHADGQGRSYDENLQNGVRSSRPSLESTARSSTRSSARSSAIELPPVQKGNILIDPMPLSREKAAVLSRTRPSWLPPKDRKEEKRHLREYQRMMAASIDAERRKEDKVRVQQCEKDDTREALTRIWEQYVCPDWERITHEHRTRELWWRGVSPKVRGQVWMRAIGNPLGLTHRSYTRALQRVKDLRVKPWEDLNDKERSTRGWYADIERDAGYTFQELHLFQRNGPLWQDLVDICCAYVSYRSDVGYLYGTQLIAALMLLQLPNSTDVFVLLANCFHGPLALAFLTNDPSSTNRFLEQASTTLLYKIPRLHRYLCRPIEEEGLGMQPADIFEATLRTLFTNGLDVERLVRVWDCFVFEGDRIAIRAAVALLGRLQAQIFGFEGSPHERKEKVQELLSWGPVGRVHGCWDIRGDADMFMADVREAGKANPGEEQVTI